MLGGIIDAGLRLLAHKVLFRESNKALKALCQKHGLEYYGENVFDYLIKASSLVFQSGTPGFEYYRSDLGRNIRFVGALLPYPSKRFQTPWYDKRLDKYEKIILVTQGTAEKDTAKLLVPVLEAFKETEVLVIVTTGGSQTKALRQSYTLDNIIIEDNIPFEDVMPYADVFVTNGGFGGVMMAITNKLPLVVAGIHEGKSEINARIGYFGLGINLKTERPQVQQVRRAVVQVLINHEYKRNVTRLSKEFTRYNANELAADHIARLLEEHRTLVEEEQEENFLF